MTLVIRDEQMAVFKVLEAENFATRIAARLRLVAPEKSGALGEARLRAFVRAGVEKAAECNIQTERDVAGLIELVLGLSDTFDLRGELAWVDAILSRKLVPPTVRFERITARHASLGSNGDYVAES